MRVQVKLLRRQVQADPWSARNRLLPKEKQMGKFIWRAR